MDHLPVGICTGFSISQGMSDWNTGGIRLARKFPAVVDEGGSRAGAECAMWKLKKRSQFGCALEEAA